MKQPKIPPPVYIQSPRALADHAPDWRNHDKIALDIESNGMFVYQEHVCLIQLSTPERDYIIDPLVQLNLTPLQEIVEDTAVEKILHASEYDLILLKRDYNWQISNLFDTMWAARILGHDKIGLSTLLTDLFGIELDKRHQRANWGYRPLTAEQLDYAQRDTHYLFNLRDYLAQQLDEQGLTREAQEIFQEQQQVTLPDTSFNPDGFWSIREARYLKGEKLAILKALYLLREEQARQRDWPHYKILGNNTLIELAKTAPRNVNQLRNISGIGERLIHMMGNQILTTIAQAKNDPVPTRPSRNNRQPDDQLIRYEALYQWRKEYAIKRGVVSDVILSKNLLGQIAAANPQSAEELAASNLLSPWRQEMYQAEIWRVLEQVAQNGSF